MEVFRASAAFYRNKHAVRCSVGKLVSGDSDIIIETNKQSGAAAFDYGNWASALDTVMEQNQKPTLSTISPELVGPFADKFKNIESCSKNSA